MGISSSKKNNSNKSFFLFAGYFNYHNRFHSYFSFPNGLPKVHEHNGEPPQALALFEKERIIVLYTYESDLGDGWEDQNIHNNPEYLRQKALKMGANILCYSMNRI